jgi:hypothetical protein
VLLLHERFRPAGGPAWPYRGSCAAAARRLSAAGLPTAWVMLIILLCHGERRHRERQHRGNGNYDAQHGDVSIFESRLSRRRRPYQSSRDGVTHIRRKAET